MTATLPEGAPRVVVYFCRECGSFDVESEHWVHLNKWDIRDESGGSIFWCPRCEEHDKYCGIAVRAQDPQAAGQFIWSTDDSEDFPSLRELIRNLRECGYRRPRAGTT